jgi:hypothetical protein
VYLLYKPIDHPVKSVRYTNSIPAKRDKSGEIDEPFSISIHHLKICSNPASPGNRI